MGKFRRFRGLATGYARKWPLVRPGALFSPTEAIERSGSPEQAELAVLFPASLLVQPLRTAHLPRNSGPSQIRETSDVCGQYDRVARGLRWRNRNNSLLLALSLARLFAVCTSVPVAGHAGGRGYRQCPGLHLRHRARPKFHHRHIALAAMRSQVRSPEQWLVLSYPGECG